MEELTIRLTLKDDGGMVSLRDLINRAGIWLRSRCPDTMLPLPYYAGHKATVNKQLGFISYVSYKIEGRVLSLVYNYQPGN